MGGEIGGAIRDDVQMAPVLPAPMPQQNRETDAEAMDRLHRELADNPVDLPTLMPFLNSLNQQPVIDEPFFALQHRTEYEHEHELLGHLVRDTSGHGIHKDAPHVAQMIHKSFEQHPRILSIYVNGAV